MRGLNFESINLDVVLGLRDGKNHIILVTECCKMSDAYEHKCGNCKKRLHKNPQRCSNCKTTYYCDRQCQLDDWKKAHRKYCNNLKKIYDIKPFEALAIETISKPPGRTKHALCCADNVVYLFGGFNPLININNFNDFWRLDGILL